MPRIFQAVLGLLWLASNGLNPTAAGGAPRNHHYPIAPITPRFSPLEYGYTPANQVLMPPAPNSKAKAEPAYGAATLHQARKDEQIKIIKQIDARIQDKNARIKKEYYLDQMTLATLDQMLTDAHTQHMPALISQVSLAYYLHFSAYLELMQEFPNLPIPKHSLIGKYEKIKPEFAAHIDLESRDLIDRIKKKFKREIPADHLKRVYIGMRVDPQSYGQLQQSIHEPKNFKSDVFMHAIREIRARSFQYDYEKLFFILEKIKDPHVHQQLSDASIMAAQFAALSIKAETDYPQERYHFDAMMAFEWEQDKFNIAADGAQLTVEEMVSVMQADMPAHLKKLYTQYISDRLIKKFVAHNVSYTARDIGDQFKKFFDALPGDNTIIYRDCIQLFLARLETTSATTAHYLLRAADYVGYKGAGLALVVGVAVYFIGNKVFAKVPYAASEITATVFDHANRRVNREKSMPPVHAVVATPVQPGTVIDHKKIVTEAPRAPAQKDTQVEKSEEEIIKEKLKEFLELVTVEHHYSRKNGTYKYERVYKQLMANFTEKPKIVWLKKSAVAKLREFIGQLHSAFADEGLASDLSDNEIMANLDKKYQIEFKKYEEALTKKEAEALAKGKKVTPVVMSDEDNVTSYAEDTSVLADVISDNYFPQPYTVYDDVAEATHSNQGSSSANPPVQKPLTAQYGYDTAPRAWVTPYLNAFDMNAPTAALKHAYALLVIKFYAAWNKKLGNSEAHAYFNALRNALAHNSIELTDDLHEQLYAILISVENLQKNPQPSAQDLHALAKQLHLTLPVKNAVMPIKDKFVILCRELTTIYSFYLQSKDKLIYTLALVNIFAQVGELATKHDIKALINESGNAEIKAAFKAIKAFRHQEYHTGDLFEDMTDVQNHLVTLIHYLAPALNQSQQAASSSSSATAFTFT